MSSRRNCIEKKSATGNRGATYGPESGIVDFIQGITFEIWEQRQVENILRYYADDVEVYSLDGITRSAVSMVTNTHKTLAAYPDRLLIADDIICSGDAKKGFSSHRLFSPMSHLGDSELGPASGRRVRIMNIADCQLNEGRITQEWLVRDNLALVQQLGFDPLNTAQSMAGRFDPELREWLQLEFHRTSGSESTGATLPDADPITSLAHTVLDNCWKSGDSSTLESSYAPYCAMHRAPTRIFSGREQILRHYAEWRKAFPEASLRVDHICSQPFNRSLDGDCHNIAVRWSVAATHEGSFAGCEPTGKPIYILGVTHWKVVDGRITAEWTIFDELAMLAQTMSASA